MYMNKELHRGYNEYLRMDEGLGKEVMMDVGMLVLEDGDVYVLEEAEKETAALVFEGACTMSWDADGPSQSL